jgi:hypothetical protein
VTNRGESWRDAFRLERPVPPTPASRRLRRLIALTAAAVIVVEAVNLLSVDEPGFSLLVRTAWALVRVIGFLFLMRSVRYGRAISKPFGLILSVTTVFAVARLSQPRTGNLLPATTVVAGFVVLTLLCSAVVWMLYKSPAVHEHLSAKPVRRHVPGWVLTARVAVLAYGALLLVPFIVAVGTLFGARRQPLLLSLVLLGAWFALFLAVTFILPFGSFFVVVGKGWARWLAGTLSVVVLVAQPVLCYLLLGPDGLIRDGVPMIVTVFVGLLALHRSRGKPTWVRVPPNPGTPPVPAQAREST